MLSSCSTARKQSDDALLSLRISMLGTSTPHSVASWTRKDRMLAPLLQARLHRVKFAVCLLVACSKLALLRHHLDTQRTNPYLLLAPPPPVSSAGFDQCRDGSSRGSKMLQVGADSDSHCSLNGCRGKVACREKCSRRRSCRSMKQPCRKQCNCSLPCLCRGLKVLKCGL